MNARLKINAAYIYGSGSYFSFSVFTCIII